MSSSHMSAFFKDCPNKATHLLMGCFISFLSSNPNPNLSLKANVLVVGSNNKLMTLLSWKQSSCSHKKAPVFNAFLKCALPRNICSSDMSAIRFI